MTPQTDPYPAADFDDWADTYERDVVAEDVFPFAGYAQMLETVVELAGATPTMSVLDIGTGTGNLAVLLAAQGCEIWGTDFSEAMLAEARAKLQVSPCAGVYVIKAAGEPAGGAATRPGGY